MNKEVALNLIEKGLQMLRDMETEFEHPPKVEPKVEETEDRPSAHDKNSKVLWYPLAKTDVTKMKTKGKYKDLYPKGAIVHFTAGRSLKGVSDAVNTSNYGASQGYVYFTISNDGSVIQGFSLDEYGSHAGVSSWPSLGENVSKYLVGIEICCAGQLDSKFTSWFGEKYSDNEVRHSDNVENIQKGFYHKYTAAQEKALIDLLCWLKHNNEEVFSFDHVLGHDECAVPTGRKNDPGASLSVTMPKFRQNLKAEYEKRYG